MKESNSVDGAHPLKIVILGLSITYSWGNSHATTYRGLMRELSALGHEVLFLERDVPWYGANRDLAKPPYDQVALYSSVGDRARVLAKHIARHRALELVSAVHVALAPAVNVPSNAVV